MDCRIVREAQSSNLQHQYNGHRRHDRRHDRRVPREDCGPHQKGENDTEEGREANRRIEFTLRLPETTAETAEAGADDAEEANEQN